MRFSKISKNIVYCSFLCFRGRKGNCFKKFLREIIAVFYGKSRFSIIHRALLRARELYHEYFFECKTLAGGLGMGFLFGRMDPYKRGGKIRERIALADLFWYRIFNFSLYPISEYAL